MLKTLLICLIAVTTISAEPKRRHRPERVDYSLTQVDRAQIHPRGDYMTTESTSSNWSGYVAGTNLANASAAKNSVSYVAGSWVVPTLSATSNGAYSAVWVGIDGYSDGTVEQIGTSHNWINGKQQNYAWFEMYPQGSYEITGFPVDSGDLITARVRYMGNNVFRLTIINQTKNVSTVIPTNYTTSKSALRGCAEWVVEAPYSGEILPLADFNTVTFSNCSAIINGVTGMINNGSWMSDEIAMVGSDGVEAQPSGLMDSGSSFLVTWKSE